MSASHTDVDTMQLKPVADGRITLVAMIIAHVPHGRSEPERSTWQGMAGAVDLYSLAYVPTQCRVKIQASRKIKLYGQ